MASLNHSLALRHPRLLINGLALRLLQPSPNQRRPTYAKHCPKTQLFANHLSADRNPLSKQPAQLRFSHEDLGIVTGRAPF
jgi:hypothetical protein